jgi:heme exporter protein CcmD
MSAFFAMGGHGAFVWGGYAVALAVLGGFSFWSWRAHTAARAEVARLEAGTRRARG